MRTPERATHSPNRIPHVTMRSRRYRSVLLAVLLASAAAATSLSCSSSPAHEDEELEERYRQFLAKRQNKEWVELSIPPELLAAQRARGEEGPGGLEVRAGTLTLENDPEDDEWVVVDEDDRAIGGDESGSSSATPSARRSDPGISLTGDADAPEPKPEPGHEDVGRSSEHRASPTTPGGSTPGAPMTASGETTDPRPNATGTAGNTEDESTPPRVARAFEVLVDLLRRQDHDDGDDEAAAGTVDPRQPGTGEAGPAPAPDRGEAGVVRPSSAGLLPARAARTPGSSSAPDQYHLEFRDLHLKDFIRLVAERADLNIITTEELEGTLTLSLRESDLRVALERILNSFGFALIEEGSITTVKRMSRPLPPTESKVYTLTSLPVGTIKSTIQELLSPTGKLVVNEQRNSFLLIDSPEVIPVVDRYVRILDIREKQVMIEAQIIEAIFNTDEEIGVDLELLGASLDDVGATYVQNLLPNQRAFTLGVFSEKELYSAFLEAFQRRRKINIVSSPQVATMNGQPAFIEVIERIPYIDSTTTTTTATGALGATSVEQVEFEEVGVKLTVTPVIGDDGVIKVEITPEVKELTDFFRGIPVTDRRKVQTHVLVPDGGTIVIGGLLRSSELKQREQVPLLGDIPFLGALFRREESRILKSELLIFVSPRILDVENPNVESRRRLREHHRKDRESDAAFH